MKECWNDDKDARPTFLKLKEEFEGFISCEERYNYLQLDIVTVEEVESMHLVPAINDCSGSEQKAEVTTVESTRC